MKASDEFIEKYYYPELKNHKYRNRAFLIAKDKYEKDKGHKAPYSGYDSLRRTIFRKRKKK